jgi:thioredoxin 1
MEKAARFRLVAAMVAAAASVSCGQKPQTKEAAPATPPPATVATAASSEPIPKIVDLGAKSCIPCKAMAPILEKLRIDYSGRLDVVFIDVWKNPGAGEEYRIRTIPTQIFYGADGRELGRHEGFIDREGILDGFRQLGVQIEE